ncbi:MAG: MarR family transcriptional regulator [Nocardioides sp.]|jgi:DNA-binding MarR family transcriptional regulator
MSERDGLFAELESEVGVLVRRLRRVLGERARAVDPALSAGHYMMLSYVERCGPLRAAAVADALEADKAAVSRKLHQLIELGLVVRTPDPEDGRAQLVSVTEGARTKLRAVASARSALLRQRLGGMSDQDLAVLVTSLGFYNRALERD